VDICNAYAGTRSGHSVPNLFQRSDNGSRILKSDFDMASDDTAAAAGSAHPASLYVLGQGYISDPPASSVTVRDH